MNKRLKYFCYSQNSINTYKSCPLKFKYKYIDNINWKYDDIESRDYYDSLKLGTEFHLLCERYFSNIPVGYEIDDKFKKWLDNIKKIIPINNDKTYLPEYEVRYNFKGNNIQAKYDLVVIGKNSIEIWDWKTESKKINYKNVEYRMQTIVYMFLAKEVITKVLNLDIDIKNIKMNYYQPEFDEKPITINYDYKKHEENKLKIYTYIDNIKRTSYENGEGNIELIRNKNHCKFCEFNKLCNGQDVDYSVLEEEFYGS
ncbi:PD-(D/E)XK nuclease family protein [Romboutsia maritimum]|uniref:PD-(D/E)XK nuclease family protein n=1 Tax=Romboutsia maritimum TaxID=2020948 RepID=A0A371ISG1_9FIRM|nr:PD-(D/E)XK nuclease family protein [Romboutsia maritimum]RDY23409.1 PD-(D/E)XK nuclease family protein [Romboutsia maritimum]